MRIDDAEQISLFGITTRLNVWTSIFVFAAALAVFIVLGRRKNADAENVYLPGREPAVETAGEFAGTEKTDDGGSSPEHAAEQSGEQASGRRAAADPVRDPDAIVSDSESRDNLPDNQNGPGHSSAPTEAVPASTGGTTSAKGSPDTGKSGASATGSASEPDGTR